MQVVEEQEAVGRETNFNLCIFEIEVLDFVGVDIHVEMMIGVGLIDIGQGEAEAIKGAAKFNIVDGAGEAVVFDVLKTDQSYVFGSNGQSA